VCIDHAPFMAAIILDHGRGEKQGGPEYDVPGSLSGSFEHEA
jgi:hypothetical protein